MHHFSAYGHALPAVEGVAPGSDLPAGTLANAGNGPSQTSCTGCVINVGTGALCRDLYVPDLCPAAAFRSPWRCATARPTTRRKSPLVSRSPSPARRRPGRSGAWSSRARSTPDPATTRRLHGTPATPWATGLRRASILLPRSKRSTTTAAPSPASSVNGNVEVRRGDIWPFGFNWISSYDTLLVDRTDTVTILQGDGQYLTYARPADGTYAPPTGDYSVLAKRADGTWMRTTKFGGKETFNALGRLTRLEDRNGNAHTLAYQPNGVTLPEGVWGITTRLASITDASGRAWVLAYGADGFVTRVTDPDRPSVPGGARRGRQPDQHQRSSGPVTALRVRLRASADRHHLSCGKHDDPGLRRRGPPDKPHRRVEQCHDRDLRRLQGHQLHRSARQHHGTTRPTAMAPWSRQRTRFRSAPSPTMQSDASSPPRRPTAATPTTPRAT